MPAPAPRRPFRPLAVVAALAVALMTLTPPAAAQGIDFNGLQHDSTQPIEITAERLEVSQTDGTALFSGEVLVVQGEARMTAGSLRVTYATDSRRIDRMEATGGVTFVTPTDAAEAQGAVYAVPAGELVMTGEVLLTQGRSAIAGDRLVVDLDAGTGRVEGRVRTVLQPRDGTGRD